MNHLEIILPGILLLIAFLLKLVIDRTVDVPNSIQAICELPVDILFLSLSFMVAHIIANKQDINEGLVFCFIFIAISIIVVVLWRKSLKYFLAGNKIWIVLFCVNLIISGLTIQKSIEILIRNIDNEESK